MRVKPISLKSSMALFAATMIWVSWGDGAEARPFEMRGLRSEMKSEEVLRDLPVLGSECSSHSCDISEVWMPTISGLKVKRRIVNYSYTSGKMESIELIVEINQMLNPDLDSSDRTAIREALTRHYGEPCEVDRDDGMFGHVTWCFDDGRLKETAWGPLESRILFEPSTESERAAERAYQEKLKGNDF